jgi:hypothetical protein
MLNKILTTPIDQLVDLVKKNENCTINFLKNSLKVPYEIVEKWILILEEYKVIEVHYKGFEGFVKYVKKEDDLQKDEKKTNDIDIYHLKESFVKKSKIRKIEDGDMKKLWPKFVLSYEVEIKEIFLEEAKKRKFNEKMTNVAWRRYREELITL